MWNQTKEFTPWLWGFLFSCTCCTYVCACPGEGARARLRSEGDVPADAETPGRTGEDWMGQQRPRYPRRLAMTESPTPAAAWPGTSFYGDRPTSKNSSSNQQCRADQRGCCANEVTKETKREDFARNSVHLPQAGSVWMKKPCDH